MVVTGGAGFLGSFVVEKLKRYRLSELFIPRSSDYDLREVEVVRRLLEEVRPDLVIHLAGQVGGIGANRANPAKFFYDNLMIGVHLLHESWKAGVEKFVAIGTICSYPKHTPVPFKEDDLWDGYPEETNAPYGLAKKMLLVQSQVYRLQYGFNSIFLIPVNLYGPRDNFDLETAHVIPSLIRKLVEAKQSGEEQVTAWGTGEPTREFLFVEDAAEGILLASERYNGGQPVNLGSGIEVSIRDLYQKIANQTGFKGKVVWDTSKPDGQPRRCLDTMKAAKFFEFRAKTSFDQGLSQTIEWYQQQRESLQARDSLPVSKP